MNPILRCIALLLVSSVAFLQAESPRWGFLGDDEALEDTFYKVAHVVYVCVTETELREVNPPFADVIYHATVIESYKGTLEVGEKIQITFGTDSLPIDDEERQKFTENANKKNKGELKFAFIHGGADGNYHCEFLDVPTYSKDMLHFLRKLQSRPPKPQAEKDGKGSQE